MASKPWRPACCCRPPSDVPGVVVDGLSAVAAALVAHAAAAQARQWWQLADTSGEPAHKLAASRLRLTPILRLGTSAGDGTAGVLAVEVLRAAADCAAAGVETRV